MPRNAPAAQLQYENPPDPIPLGEFLLEKRRFAAVYFLCRRGEVVYVGQSKSLTARIDQHIEDGVKVFDAVSFVRCSVNHLTKMEGHYIRRYNPKYNACNVAKKVRERETWRSMKPSKFAGKFDHKPGDPIVLCSAEDVVIDEADIGEFMMVCESDANAWLNSGSIKDRSLMGLFVWMMENHREVGAAQDRFEDL